MSLPAECHACLQRGLAQLGLPLPAERVAQLIAYLDLLLRWNRTYNLTAIREPLAMVETHLLDSLAILPFVRGRRLADLGTGPGLPGLVLAIAAPERRYQLVDSNGKKVRFLREVIRQLGLQQVVAEQGRVETLAGDFDCITARAFASLGDMLRWGGHLLAADGIWLAMKGRPAAAELAAIPAGFKVQAIHSLAVPGLAATRQLLEIRRCPHAPAPAGSGNLLTF